MLKKLFCKLGFGKCEEAESSQEAPSQQQTMEQAGGEIREDEKKESVVEEGSFVDSQESESDAE